MRAIQASAKVSKKVSLDTVKAISDLFDEPGWLRKIRERAWKAFSSLEIPSPRYGIGIHTDLSGIQINHEEILASAKKFLTEKNHVPQKGLPSGVSVLGLREAINNQADLLKSTLFSLNRPEENWYTALQAALWTRGVFIHVPQGIEAKSQVQLSLNGGQDTLIDQVLVVAEPNTSITIVESASQGESKTSFRSQGVEILAANNARVSYAAIQTMDPDAITLSTRKAIVGESGRLDWIDCCLGSKTALTSIMNTLQGRGSEGYVHGLFFATGNQHFDLDHATIHDAPDTTSDMHTRGALSGTAHCIYHGLVKVTENAPGSNGYQKEEALLLSTGARADSIPNLEINNNDVSCTHGATLGQIDKETIFYLMSRGLERKESIRMIVRGFFTPLFKRIQVKAVREELRGIINEKIYQ